MFRDTSYLISRNINFAGRTTCTQSYVFMPILLAKCMNERTAAVRGMTDYWIVYRLYHNMFFVGAYICMWVYMLQIEPMYTPVQK